MNYFKKYHLWAGIIIALYLSVGITAPSFSQVNDPSVDIPNVVFHFNAKDIDGDLDLSDQPGDNSQMRTWGDRSDNASGSGSDLPFDNNGNRRPRFLQDAFGDRGGVEFDGNNDILIRASDNLINMANFDEKSFALVFRTGNSVSGLQVIYEQGGTVRGYGFSIKDGNLYAFTYNSAEWSGGNQYKTIDLGPVSPNTSYTLIASHDASSGNLNQRVWRASLNSSSIQSLNNVDVQRSHPNEPGIGGVNSQSVDPITNNSINGTGDYFQGQVVEIISWNYALSDQEFDDVYNYLDNEWFGESAPTPTVVWQSNDNPFILFFGLEDEWNRGYNWSTGQVPGPDDVVLIPTNPSGYDAFPIIRDDYTIDGLQIENGADVTIESSSLVVQDDLLGAGAFQGNNSTLEVGGDITLANLSPDNSTLILNGSALQALSGSININNLQLQNTSGVESSGTIVTQTADIPSSNLLSLTSGATFEASGDITGNGALSADQSTLTFGGDISSLSSVDVATSTVLFNGDTLQLISNFNEVTDLEIDNPTEVVVTPGNNLEVTGILTLTSGLLTMDSGTNLIANTKNLNGGQLKFLRELTGTKGWRLLTSPVASTYGDFLDSVVTQGYSGAFYDYNTSPNDTLQPNVLYYDETYPGTDNQRWRAPTDSSSTPTAGQGHFVYIFGDIAADSRYSNTLPDTLNIIGQEHEGNGTNFTFPVTYTPEADSGWNLVGNPFGATIDWDDNAEWTKSNIDGSIYIWDPGTSSYKTWNGVTGSLNNGLIAPFQGFWVKANGNSPVLRVNKNAKTTGGTYKGKRKKKDIKGAPVVELKAARDGVSVSTFLMFSKGGTNSKDPLDAYNLVLPPGISNYMEFFTINEDGQRFAINHLPRRFGKPIEIPLELNNFKEGIAESTEITISWPEIKNIPQGWAITLIDNQNNTSTNLSVQNKYQFIYSASKKKSASNASNYRSSFSVTKKSKPKDARFTLRISPGEDADGLPSEFTLNQNYPNPFNPQTTIPFSLPVESEVKITIYDILGRRVTTLINETLRAGTHEVQWNASRLASGIYIYRMQAKNQVITKKLTIIK